MRWSRWQVLNGLPQRGVEDAITRACDTRIAPALAAQLSAEQRYANQDAEHKRSTRELRAELAAAHEAIHVRADDASAELTSSTKAVTVTCGEVRDVARRLEKVERTLATRRRGERVPATPAPAETKPSPGVAPVSSPPVRVGATASASERAARPRSANAATLQDGVESERGRR